MSRRKVTRQRPVHLDHCREEYSTRTSPAGGKRTSYSGSKLETCFRDIENTLNKYPLKYADIDKHGLDICTTHVDLLNDESEYVRLSVGRTDKDKENIFLETFSKEGINNSEGDSDLRPSQKENISPISEPRPADDCYSDGDDDVYVTLRNVVTSDTSRSAKESELFLRVDGDNQKINTDTSFYPLSQYKSGKLTAKAILEPLSPQLRYQPYLKIEPFSDTESLVSTEVNQREYLKQLKEFEQSLDGAVWKRKLWQMESKKHGTEVTPHEDADIPGSCEIYGGASSAGEKFIAEPESGEISGTTGPEFEVTENVCDGNVSLENIIHDFLQYFQSKRHSVKMTRTSIYTKDETDGKPVNEDKNETGDSQDKLEIDMECIAKENLPHVPYSDKSVDAPSPPPRRSHAEKSRGHQNQYGDHGSPSRNYRENIPVVSRQCDTDKSVTSSRSPSIRKRDIMMRRYNSTSVLPIVTPVDMNKNHIMDSRSNYSVPTNGHLDNGIRESMVVNGNQSEGHPDDGRFEHTLVHMDIVGDSYEARYPWQRDISTQCNLSAYRNSVSSESVSSGSEWSSYTADNNENCSKYVNSNYMNNKSNPARRQSSDNIRRRHHVFRTRRPRSMTCLETDNTYNNTSDMYRSDTNLNYRHGRTMSETSIPNSPNRKRMPLLLADDPGSVSDLESILENPNDGNTDRNNSLGGDSISTDISANLRRLEHVRGSSADLSRDTSEDRKWSSSTAEQLRNVLPSPRVSPEMWNEVPEVVVNTERDDYDAGEMLRSMNWNANFLSVPRKPQRRLSSGSLQSGSDESDNEIAPPVARRGRRAAIVDTKNFGDVSPTTLSPEVSPSNSCDEGDTGSNIAERLRRRRSSHDVSMNVYPGDLLVQEHHKKLIKRNTISDFYAGRNGSTPALSEDNKKQRQPFSLLKLMKTRSKESLHLCDVLKELKPSEFKDNHLAAYKNVHWTDLIASTDKQSSITDTLNISEMERKRRESVWELFKSECVFLIDHLMVLKHCFLEPLKKCQVEGFLMYAEPSEIFSNLDELCYVSYTFCKDFISSLLKDMSATDFGSTAVLIKAFQRFSKHSKDGSVYHTYCLNYTNALSYLEKLRKNDDFCEFEKWSEQDQRCNRLQLADLLIGPMQHCTKLPLLLQNIQKYTEDPVEKTQIVESIEKVEMSLRQLEEKMKWLKNFERVQEIQRHLIWPSITDLDSRAFIPEYLKPRLSRQPCERLLACPSRQLIHEGAITLTESTKNFDAYMFLFDDILLITKIKKPNRKKQSSSDIHSATGQPDNQMYTVHRQPIALDRLGVHDVMPPEAAANGLKCAFVIVQISRFQQIIDVFTLQATSEAAKGTWISHILEVKGRRRACNNNKGNSAKENEDPSPPSSRKKGRHGKSLSIDAVFL